MRFPSIIFVYIYINLYQNVIQLTKFSEIGSENRQQLAANIRSCHGLVTWLPRNRCLCFACITRHMQIVKLLIGFIAIHS